MLWSVHFLNEVTILASVVKKKKKKINIIIYLLIRSKPMLKNVNRI